MAEPKTRHTREIDQVDATAEYTHEIKTILAQQYPLITELDSNLYQDFLNREIPFCSFDVTRKGNEDLVAVLLSVALESADSPGDLAYSDHGSEHTTYRESIARLRDEILEGYAFVDFEKEFTGQAHSRLVVKTRQFMRTGTRPAPHQFALSLERLPETGKLKLIRKATLKHGVSFGVLASLYSGFDPRKVFEIFKNPDFQLNLRRQFGDDIIIPSTSRKRGFESDINYLLNIWNTVMVTSEKGIHPSLSSDAYNEAISWLIQIGWLNAEDYQNNGLAYGFEYVRDEAHALGVFRSMTEIADRAADPDFGDPVKANFIQREYAGRSSSKLVTAYLVITPKSQSQVRLDLDAK